MIKVIIADDDKNLRKVLLNELYEEGFNVTETDDGIKTIELLEKNEYDVLLLDLNMPGLGGLEVLEKIKELEVPSEVIILTAHATVSTAVEAMKMGAYDYLTKPFQIEELKTIIEKAYEKKQLLKENLLLKSQIRRQSEAKDIITESPCMVSVLQTVRKIAVSSLPILIYGESGVGKELIAKNIHSSSDRSEGPFIPINCGAIPETMLETELFGHEKGSFTGAYAKKLGLLEIANNGTLFLDEISELSQRLQGKLLRVIETETFFRVGGLREIKVDVRFVAATNRDIKKDVETGAFRPDLYYRIGALTLRIPPLRERREDIPLLVQHIIHIKPEFKHKKLSDKAMEILVNYAWPGNVRELQNVIYRALFLSSGSTIEPHDLSPDLTSGTTVSGRRLEDIEKDHILKVFREVNGQKRKAAEILGVDPKTLYRKLHRYGIDG
ncbi:MAG TPA: sigma-54 dependent transcriptional regulator [Thermodesulfovibrionales bacterium]|nr:sigma-54 dependent transcriptional regulator [Thermodesulfovibrionales bacterium]